MFRTGSLFLCAIFFYSAGGHLAYGAEPSLSVAERITVSSYDFDAAARSRVIWSQGTLVTVEGNSAASPTIHAFDARGVDSPVTIVIPQARIVHISDVAHASNGILVAVGNAHDDEGHGASFIASVSADRQTTTVTRLSQLFLPQLVTVAPDESIWVKGWEPTDVSGRTINPSAPTIRHFSRTGQLIGALLRRQDGHIMHRLMLTSSYGWLVSSESHVGWMQNEAPYYEISSDGKSVEQYPAVPFHAAASEAIIGFAMTADGEVFASTSLFAGAFPQGYYLYTLDRSRREWISVPLPQASAEEGVRGLIGGNDRLLVFRTSTHGVLSSFTVQ